MSNERSKSLFSDHVNVITLPTRLMDMMCSILFILGIVGNVSGLFIFSLSRRTWRISSIYACLATCSSITNVLCVIRYAFLLHSTSRYILRQLVEQTWWACKFFEFSFSFRIISSWITLFWMFERLMCVSTRLRTSFNQWIFYKLNFMTPIIILILILGGVIGPPVYMYQPEIIPNNNTMNSTINIMYCGLNSNVSVRWQKYFHDINFGMNYFTVRCLFSELIPAGAVILFNSYIVYHIVRTCRHLPRPSGDKSRPRQIRTTSWMNIVLILHSFLFFTSLFSHLVGHFTVIEAHETWWILLAILINCSINFYIYCLSGKAFRNEIRRFLHRLKTRFFNRSQTRQQQSYQSRRFIYQMTDFHGRNQL